MSESQTRDQDTSHQWPEFTLDYTFNPDLDGIVGDFDPDEVVLFERQIGMTATRWLSAERDSYVALNEVR